MRFIDQFLNSITMYRLVLYGLTLMALVALVLAAVGALSYSVASLAISLVVVIAICWMANFLISHIFKVPANVESVYITAFILFLILPPATTLVGASTLAVASVLAMASKYLLAWRGRHLFNPAALAVLVWQIGVIFLWPNHIENKS